MTLPTVSQANVAAEVSETGCVHEAWEAELWMLMRSLKNVLDEMKSSFSEVILAHIYTSCEANLDAVRCRVLGYMSREAGSEVDPLMTLSVVPRLPKDGQIEINLICSAESASCSSCTSFFTYEAGSTTS